MGDSSEISKLATELAELRATARATEDKVDDLRSALRSLTEAMTSVVRLDVEFKKHEGAMTALQQRQDTIVKRIDALHERLGAMEREMPGLLEARQWVVRAMTLVVTIVAAAVLGLVIVKH